MPNRQYFNPQIVLLHIIYKIVVVKNVIIWYCPAVHVCVYITQKHRNMWGLGHSTVGVSLFVHKFVTHTAAVTITKQAGMRLI